MNTEDAQIEEMISEWMDPEHVHGVYVERATSPDHAGRFTVTPVCSCGKIMGMSYVDSVL